MSFVLPAKAPGDTVKFAVSFASFAGSASLSSYTLVRAVDPNGTATVTSSQSGYVINCVFAGGGVSGALAAASKALTAIDLADLRKPLWQIAGYTDNPGGMLDIVGTLNAAAGAAGTITLTLLFGTP